MFLNISRDEWIKMIIGGVVGVVLTAGADRLFPDALLSSIINEARSEGAISVSDEIRKNIKEVEINNRADLVCKERLINQKSTSEKACLSKLSQARGIINSFNIVYEQVGELYRDVLKYASQARPGDAITDRLNKRASSLMNQMNEKREHYKSISSSFNSDATELLNFLNDKDKEHTVYDLKTHLQAIMQNEKINRQKIEDALNRLGID